MPVPSSSGRRSIRRVLLGGLVLILVVINACWPVRHVRDAGDRLVAIPADGHRPPLPHRPRRLIREPIWAGFSSGRDPARIPRGSRPETWLGGLVERHGDEVATGIGHGRTGNSTAPSDGWLHRRDLDDVARLAFGSSSTGTNMLSASSRTWYSIDHVFGLMSTGIPDFGGRPTVDAPLARFRAPSMGTHSRAWAVWRAVLRVRSTRVVRSRGDRRIVGPHRRASTRRACCRDGVQEDSAHDPERLTDALAGDDRRVRVATEHVLDGVELTTRPRRRLHQRRDGGIPTDVVACEWALAEVVEDEVLVVHGEHGGDVVRLPSFGVPAHCVDRIHGVSVTRRCAMADPPTVSARRPRWIDDGRRDGWRPATSQRRTASRAVAARQQSS